MSAARHLHAVSSPVDPTVPTGEATQTAPPSSVRVDLAPLLTATGRGSAVAYEQLYNEVAGAVYGVALRVVRDTQMAEDIAQEALIEVWRHAARYRADAGSARSWILTIAQRRAVDRVRSEQSHTDRVLKHAPRDDVAPAEQDKVVDTLFAEWQAARVRVGMEQLTERQREALELTYFKGYTHREVSQALDIPLGTAKARVRDGLIKLRDAWEAGA
ncbi:sigma-70 family RNA polymerase sigma factor [Demequina aurantiaca]|uniref:sigma-70 family RNA polymerase sigma factor n=1 Tax=Demequina aurantiaca TaxID=676200 RepID=UPI000A0059D2|nr:sigma-70 family RNA polymerase sigma factor [Demequina aurantiaca]